jgi:4'-phosphopantetheinyl transferase
MVEVFALRLPEVSEFNKRREEILKFLSEDRREYFTRFKSSQSAMRSVYGELLTRYILAKKTGISFSLIDFKKTDIGKPYLEQDSAHFNLSHSGEWVVFAFSEKNVGIDVELVREIRYQIAERFYSPDENKRLGKLTGGSKLNYFFDLWTLKESYLKMIGTGLTKSLSSFTVFEEGNQFHLTDHETGKRLLVHFRQYALAADYKLSVCSAKPEFCEHLIIVNPSELEFQIESEYENRK